MAEKKLKERKKSLKNLLYPVPLGKLRDKPYKGGG